MRASLSLGGLIRKRRLAILKKDAVIAGHCGQCSACCYRVNLDIDGQWIRSRARLNELAGHDPLSTFAAAHAW